MIGLENIAKCPPSGTTCLDIIDSENAGTEVAFTFRSDMNAHLDDRTLSYMARSNEVDMSLCQAACESAGKGACGFLKYTEQVDNNA